MNRLFPHLILIIFLLVGVTTAFPIVAGSPFEDPLINDWLHNDTDEESSHVSNYSIDSIDEYFVGDQGGPNKVEEELSEDDLEEDTTIKELYKLHDPTFREYQTEPVYNKWNENNVYDYQKRPLIPEFAHGDTKSEQGDSVLGLGNNEYLLSEGWVGIYSIEPSAYVHYGPPEDDESFGQSKQVVGDTMTVASIVHAKHPDVPDTRTEGSGVGAHKYSYSVEEVTYSADVYIENSSVCPSRCYVGSAPVSQDVAEFTGIDVDEYAEPGDNFTVIVEGSASVTLEEDVEEQYEERVEVPCEDPENQTAPCYDYELEWEDDGNNTITEDVSMSDRQNVTYPKGVNGENVNQKVTYERGVYPNGTTEIHLNTSELDGTFTETGIWRMIKIGDERMYSNWRTWSSRNMTWDIMYESDDSNEEHMSHTRPLAFHTAPTEYGMSSTDGIEFRRTEYSGYGRYFALISGTQDTTYYESPTLRRDKTCMRKLPEHKDNPEEVNCGWWITGTGTITDDIEEPPYLEINETGSYQVYDEVYIDAPNSASDTQTLDMYGFVPGESTEIEPDRNVEIQPTRLYAVVKEKKIRNESAEYSYVEVVITLINEKTNERINTEERGETIIVQNASIADDGDYTPAYVDTNESGQVTVRVYNPSKNDIKVSYSAKDWTQVEEDETAYVDTELNKSVSTPAFQVSGLIKTIIGIMTVFYVITALGVRFLGIIQYPVATSTREELEKMFPGEWWKIILWGVIVYMVLSVL